MRLLAAPLASYWSFLRANPRFIAFGFILTLASSFGQTFFIALFSADIRAAFGLTDGGFGLVYSLVTLASAFSLIWIGPLVDRVDLRAMTLAVCTGMLIACALMGLAPVVLVLAIAIYLLRLSGQGLLGHVSITAMARYFDKSRGKAISIASLGYAAGEAALPLIGVAMIAWFGWRQAWLAIALLFLVMVIPLVLWLLRGHQARHQRYVDALSERDAAGDPAAPVTTVTEQRHWTRAEAVRDWRLYLLMPAALAPAFIVTGLFFHQVRMVEEKGWALAWFAACFIGFAAAQLPSALASGELIDRFGARRLMPFYLLPLGAAMIVLAFVDHPAAAMAMMMLMGLTSGAVGPVVSSTLAEVYGVKHLGSIRALSTSLMVFSTSLSPFLMGALIDRNVPISTMALGFVALIGVVSVLVALALRR